MIEVLFSMIIVNGDPAAVIKEKESKQGIVKVIRPEDIYKKSRSKHFTKI